MFFPSSSFGREEFCSQHKRHLTEGSHVTCTVGFWKRHTIGLVLRPELPNQHALVQALQASRLNDSMPKTTQFPHMCDFCVSRVTVMVGIFYGISPCLTSMTVDLIAVPSPRNGLDSFRSPCPRKMTCGGL